MPYNLPDYLMDSGLFRFERLILEDIDNGPVLSLNDPAMAQEEICLFHREVSEGNEYMALLDAAVVKGLAEHRALPVVRFADGEYAFYGGSLECNGLYRQAESRATIKTSLPDHVRALKRLARIGILAPLIFPGNTAAAPRQSWLRLPWTKKKTSASTFLEFLQEHGIRLTKQNYVPFYVVYAYLTSQDFARRVDGQKVCIVNSEYNASGCRAWFERFDSHPEIVFALLPATYVATQWEVIREDLLPRIPADTAVCLVGAGVGALPVCVDVAEGLSIPALDAGHVLNLMNDRVDKSNGARLYTQRAGGRSESEKSDV